ncbi:hypothetical protein HPP92_014640 [Vanilla planifolia]|uniref:Uncharacterized protein n=1 Tax=Vanilla planifolia TaxID=51239 RepID=A0A835QJQ2_VANPL|nr:hypothetical protein HPP92_014640 [Vanilla planifolia]
MDAKKIQCPGKAQQAESPEGKTGVSHLIAIRDFKPDYHQEQVQECVSSC